MAWKSKPGLDSPLVKWTMSYTAGDHGYCPVAVKQKYSRPWNNELLKMKYINDSIFLKGGIILK